MYLHLVSILENNYPEMMKQMFVINGMAQFKFIFNYLQLIVLVYLELFYR